MRAQLTGDVGCKSDVVLSVPAEESVRLAGSGIRADQMILSSRAASGPRVTRKNRCMVSRISQETQQNKPRIGSLREEPSEGICMEMGLTATQFRLLKSRAKQRYGDSTSALARVFPPMLSKTDPHSGFKETLPKKMPYHFCDAGWLSAARVAQSTREASPRQDGYLAAGHS